MPFEAAFILAFPVLVTLAAAFDLLTMTIPNRLNLALAAAFPAAALATGMAGEAVLLHLALGAGMLALGFALFLPGWIGGGDAKFVAAAALWLEPSTLLAFGIYASLLGGGLTLLTLSARQLALPARMAVRFTWLQDAKAGVPYGLALGAAALIVWPDTQWFEALLG